MVRIIDSPDMTSAVYSTVDIKLQITQTEHHNEFVFVKNEGTDQPCIYTGFLLMKPIH